MEVPPNHPFLWYIFPYKPSSYWGTTMAMETSSLITIIHHHQSLLTMILGLKPWQTVTNHYEQLLTTIDGTPHMIQGFNVLQGAMACSPSARAMRNTTLSEVPARAAMPTSNGLLKQRRNLGAYGQLCLRVYIYIDMHIIDQAICLS